MFFNKKQHSVKNRLLGGIDIEVFQNIIIKTNTALRN